MKTPPITLSAVATLLLAFSASAAAHESTGVRDEIRKDMADARREVRTELAQARRDLETDNVSLHDSLRFGDDHDGRKGLPPAEITPAGDFLVEGQPQAITPGQRRQLLAYRGLLVDIAGTGIDIGERSAEAALDAVGDGSLLKMMFGAMTGSLERKVERVVREEVGPAVLDICRQLPVVMASQQRLASSLPAFRPYATLEPDDIDDCGDDVREAFASR